MSLAGGAESLLCSVPGPGRFSSLGLTQLSPELLDCEDTAGWGLPWDWGLLVLLQPQPEPRGLCRVSWKG